jgi:GGDEF domain-containing protein
MSRALHKNVAVVSYDLRLKPEDGKLIQNPFSIVFLDMDNFKQVVDTYGYLNESQLLIEVANTIGGAVFFNG